ncbi:hypothetical protein JXQ70_13485 [bacterium]|nr:hypothetical protein [bacterium]
MVRNDLLQMKNLEEQVTRGTVPQFIVFHGEETWLIHNACRKVLDLVQPDLQAGLDFSKWDGESDTFDAFLEDIRNYPFLVERKIFFCPAGEVLLSKKGNATLRQKFEGLLERDLPEQNVLIISCSGSADKSLKVVKKLSKAGIMIEFPLLKTYNPGDPHKDEVYPYLHEHLDRCGCELMADAFFELRKRAPDNLWALMNEIEKLLAFVGEHEVITIKDVKTITARNKSEQFFDLTDALGARRLDEVLAIFNTILTREPNVLALHHFLVQHMYRLFLARQLITDSFRTGLPRGFNYNTLVQTWLPRWNKQFDESEKEKWAPVLKLHPFVLLKTLQTAAAFNDNELLSFISNMTELEVRVKSGIINHQARLELLLVRFCKQ